MRLKDRSFAILLTCIMPFVVVPNMFAQTNSKASEARSEPRDESAGAAVSRVLPKPQSAYSHPHTNTRPYANTVAHSECDEAEAQESDKVAPTPCCPTFEGCWKSGVGERSRQGGIAGGKTPADSQA